MLWISRKAVWKAQWMLTPAKKKTQLNSKKQKKIEKFRLKLS